MALYFFIKKEASIDFNGDLTSLSGYAVGKVRGYSYGKAFDNATYFKQHETGDEHQLIKMLLRGRVDIAVGNKVVINEHAAALGASDKIITLHPPFDTTPAYFAFSKAKKNLGSIANDFSKQIKALLPTEKYKKILKKYHIEPHKP